MTSNYYEMENEGSKSAELTAVPSLTNYAYPTMGGETTAIDVVDEDDASPSPANDQRSSRANRWRSCRSSMTQLPSYKRCI